jgi:hypothetical protein
MINISDLVTTEVALKAKSLGFDEPCDFTQEGSMIYMSHKPKRNSDDSTQLSIPTWQKLALWLLKQK